jgi:phage gpG-like protein
MRSLSELARDFKAMRAAYQKLHIDTPRIMGVIAVKVAKANFDKQGFDDGCVKPWQKRKKSTDIRYSGGRGKKGKSNYKGSVFSAGNPILKQTGNLYDGIHYIVSSNKVSVGVNLNTIPYAKIHNEGGTIKVFGKYTARMPKRQYLGWSPRLSMEIKAEIKTRRKQAFKLFIR